MAGHSAFKNIMHKKGRKDAVRAKVFTKIGREIAVAAKMGGPDPAMNPRLRLALKDARAENMPKDNIDRAIKKATSADTEAFKAVRYEGYAPGGVAIIIEALTDNVNRTAPVVRAAFAKHGGNLGSTGSVAHMFAHSGEITYKPDAGSADAVMDAAIEAGADDVVSDANGHVIVCAFDALGTVAGALESKLGDAVSVKAVWKPTVAAPVDEAQLEPIMKLIAQLEDDDDVQTVFANFEISEDVLKRLTAA
ncbi:MAG: YebC/PmpR family DNA-binding transcriptional regulator [Hyphomicrobium aestuarii]|nr:YebC/PmpR family DNA-binding transcriptional regulator [Hyphomicrobium aestuarii]